MKALKGFMSAALAAAIFGSMSAFAAAAAEENVTSTEVTKNYLKLKMSGGSADIEYEDGQSSVTYPDVGGEGSFAIPVGRSGSITIDRVGEIITSVKIGSSTAKRDMTKVSDTKYSFTVQDGDTELEVIFASDATDTSSEVESSAPAPSEPAPTTPTRPEPEPERDEPAETATHESAPEADTPPDTGIALAAAPAILAAAAVIVSARKRK